MYYVVIRENDKLFGYFHSNNASENRFKSKISMFVHAQFVTCVIVE